jgi:hypothetical protein
MTKSKWIVVVVLAGALITVGAFKRTSASNDRTVQAVQTQDPHQHHQMSERQAGTPVEMPPLLVDGATNPQAVSDLVAYEFLFRSIADGGANETNAERDRAKILLDKSKLGEKDAALLKAAANGFKGGLTALDAQAKTIKDRNWPNPSRNAIDRLAQLQQQKETMLKQRMDSFLSLMSEDQRAKLNERILEIKRKVKVYQDVPVEKYQKR